MPIYHHFMIFLAVLGFVPICAVAEEAPVIQLEDVQVLGREPVQSTLEQAPSQISLSAQEVKNLPGTGDDPLKALTALAGVKDGNVGQGGGSGVYIRGSSTQDNAYRVDGVPVGYLYHYGGLFSLISQDVLSGFDVYPSGFGVEFDDRLGGIIDIRLRNPQMDQWHQKLHLGTYDASVFVEGPLSEKDGLYANIRRSYIDLVLTGLKKEGTEFIQFPKFTDGFVRWHHDFDDGSELSGTFIGSSDELAIQLADEAVKNDKAVIGRLSSEQGFNSFGFRYTSDLNAHWQQDTTWGYLHSESQFKIGTQQITDPNPGQPYNFNFSNTSHRVQPQLRWFVDKANDVQFGLEAISGEAKVTGYLSAPPSERDTDYDLTSAVKYTLNETSHYTQASPYVRWSRFYDSGLETSLGLRYSDYTQGQTHLTGLSPRGSLAYPLNDEQRLTASWGLYLQVPQGYELSQSLGNPQLDWQKAQHRTLGLQQQLDELWSASIEIYQKPLWDLVVETGNAQAGQNFNNNGSGEARGLDVFLKRRPSEGRQAWLSYTYAESTRINHNTGERRPFDGDEPHALSVLWQAPMGGNWTAWQWGANFWPSLVGPIPLLLAEPQWPCQG